MVSILFVDDESLVLSGLRRMLRPMRHEWEMNFVESGKEALEWLESNPCDVVVSDMRMPQMDGAKLLGEIREKYPRIIRLALSGHSEMQLLLESVRATHQFLAKPCDAETLKSTIERAIALRELLEDGKLSTLISQIDSLPSLPSLYMEIMNEISSSDSSMVRVGDIISHDVGMTAKILQIVNSAFFGLKTHISSPAQAASMLGLDTIRSLILTSKVFSSVEQQKSDLDLDALWQHSLHVGSLAREIAITEELDTKNRDYALMAGMLHDVGKLVLATCLPVEYVKVMALMRENNIAQWQAEQKILGCTHMEVGAYLLGIWGLPNQIIEALAYHDNPGRSVGDEITPLTVVHVANALVVADEMGTDVTELLDMKYIERLGFCEHVPVWETAFTQLKQNDGTE